MSLILHGLRLSHIMNSKIFIKDWLRLKPYKNQGPTDLYYLKIANDVKKVFMKYSGFGLSAEIHNENLVNLFSCFLTSYFEDIISKSGIWEAFISMHVKMYGKKLPFYPADDYVDGEINQQDVSFLIWYIVNAIQNENIVFPNSDSIAKVSGLVMEIFEGEFEYAPENEKLKSFYTLDNAHTDYYGVRHLIDTVLFRTYLFFPDTSLKLQELEIEIINANKGELTLQYLNNNRDFFLHKSHTSLLGIKGKDWAAELLGKGHHLYQDTKDISPRIAGYFFYKGQDESDVFLEHIASGKQFKMTKKSYDHSSELREIDSILYIGLVRWQNEWWFSGVISLQPFDAELVKDEKKSMQSRSQVDFLDFGKKEVGELLEIQMESFLNFNNGSLIAFIPKSEFEDFGKDFIDYYNNSLKLSANQMEKSFNRAEKEAEANSKKEQKSLISTIDEPGLVFFNPKSGLEMAWGVTDAFPLPENPCFDAEESEDSIMTLLISPNISKELLTYSIDHCKSDLNFFQKNKGKIVLNDLDFLMRFFKKEYYHTKPSISLVGSK